MIFVVKPLDSQACTILRIAMPDAAGDGDQRLLDMAMAQR